MKEHTVKWGDIEQRGDIEQSHPFGTISLSYPAFFIDDSGAEFHAD